MIDNGESSYPAQTSWRYLPEDGVVFEFRSVRRVVQLIIIGHAAKMLKNDFNSSLMDLRSKIQLASERRRYSI